MQSTKNWLLILLVLVSACASSRQAINPDEMYERASALTKLSAAMEAYIRYGHPLASATEAQLLEEGTRHDPALLSNLGDYKMRVLSQDRHALVLMCTTDGGRALLEDAGCTGKMDVHHWQQANVPCEFSVSVATVCSGN
jgi:hypothetical protein